MAYVTCPHGSNYFPFGRGGKNKIFRYLEVPEQQPSKFSFHSIPLLLENDELEEKVIDPIVIRNPSSPSSVEFSAITQSMISSLFHHFVEQNDSLVSVAKVSFHCAELHYICV